MVSIGNGLGNLRQGLRALRRLPRSRLVFDAVHADGLVYSAGKDGGSSIQASLASAGLHYGHVHWLAPENIAKFIDNPSAEPKRSLADHVLESVLARARIRQSRPIDMIVPLREPLSRNVSAVFQNLGYKPHMTVDDALARIGRYAPTLVDHWFYSDFIPLTGLDVLDDRVDPAADHHILSAGLMRILIIRMDLDRSRQADILRAFTRRTVAIVSSNEAADKWYDGLYRQTLELVPSRLPRFVEQSLGQKYFQAFYPAEFREQIRARYAP